jgi:signal transduction histidine kinase
VPSRSQARDAREHRETGRISASGLYGEPTCRISDRHDSDEGLRARRCDVGSLLATVERVTVSPPPEVSLASEPRPTLEDRYVAARDTLLIEFGARWVSRKPWVLAIHKVVTAAVLVVSDYDATRTRICVLLWLVTLAFDVVEARTLRPEPGADVRIAVGTGIGMLCSGIASGLTGGIASPVVPSLLVAVVIPAAAFGNRPPTYALLAELVLLTTTLAFLPESIVGPAIAPGYFELAYVLSIVFAGWVAVTNLVALTEVYAEVAVMMGRMRDEALALHESRARSLESVGAKVAHEIKNPLAAIAGLVQLLARGKHDDKTLEHLRVIESEVGRIESVVRDYLAFSRPLEVVTVASTLLAGIADDVLALLDARAHKRGVTLRREGDGVADADAQRLKEALLNVIDNAVDASPSGAEVRVRASVADGVASFVVTDHGSGIAADVLARVGTPYFTTKPSGTGLGIVLARAVLQQHGGRLDIESERRRGTKVTLTWPATPAARESEAT